MSEEQRDEVEVTGPGGTKFRARGYDVLVILVVLICTVNAAFMYQHMDDAKRAASVNAETQKEMAKAIQEGTRVQRLSVCLQATKEEEKEGQYMKPNSYCNRMSQ